MTDSATNGITANEPAGKRVAIVGGGLMGMVLAYRYSKLGYQAVVFEGDSQVGGLATWTDISGTTWDKFYHVILPSDTSLVNLLREIGLGDDLHWQQTYTGFYVNEELHSISSNLEFLKFPLLSLWSKFRLGITMLYGSRINDWQKLEKLTCEEWLTRISGRETYEKMWKPLLLAKLGHSHSRVSAVFIWSYIKRMFSARDKSASSEHLGHVTGGYKMIFDALSKQIAEAGGEIRLSTRIQNIQAAGQREEGNKTLTLQSTPGTAAGENNAPMASDEFDEVVLTIPTPFAMQVTEPGLLEHTPGQGEVEYLGVVCGILVTREPMSKFYVINIADDSIYFTGAIGMSTVMPAEHTDGLHMTYLPKYMISTDDEFDQPDDYFREKMFDGLEKMFPEFKRDEAIDLHIHRAKKVQPLQVLDYSTLVPSVSTNHDNLYVLNTSQFVNATLNNNQVVTTVNQYFEDRGLSSRVPGHRVDSHE